MIFVEPRQPGGLVFKQAYCSFWPFPTVFASVVLILAAFVPGVFDFDVIGAVGLLIF